jgi:hypothetical protein
VPDRARTDTPWRLGRAAGHRAAAGTDTRLEDLIDNDAHTREVLYGFAQSGDLGGQGAE